MNLVSTSRISKYWERFPDPLRVITKTRLWAAIGAGGVLYLNSLIFNTLEFTAEQIGSGISSAAFAGIITRFGTGYLLDKNYSYKNAIKIACLIAILSDFILFNSQNYSTYIIGQFWLGAAAGIYWPSVELAIPLNCNNKIKSSEAYALARSADAIGITLGVSIGTIGTYFEFIKIVYAIDIYCMIYIIYILLNKKYILDNKNSIGIKNINQSMTKKEINNSILALTSLLIITLFITGVMSLLQNVLPIDLAIGGHIRPALIESRVASMITYKLLLLAILQWPVGYLIRKEKIYYKFRLCLISLLIGFILMTLSSIFWNGYILILIAFIPITISLCIFLPSASDAIIKFSPAKYRGSFIALYSQCFGITAIASPWIAGKLIDNFNNALLLWIIISFICILLIPITNNIK